MVVTRMREQNSAYGLLIPVCCTKQPAVYVSTIRDRGVFPLNRYHWQENAQASSEASRRFAESLDIPEAGARFLIGRKIATTEDAANFLYSRIEHSHDPFAFRHMKQAVASIRDAIDKRKTILVHGDYDADGISGTALLYLYLDGLVPEVFRFLPDRKKDGYGLAARAVDWACKEGVGLVITVDCGVSDGELVRTLENAGIGVIICDHHEFPDGETVPGIVLNPIRDDYPFSGLSGAGVAYKLVEALNRSDIRGSVRPHELLDLVALSTVGDLVPLVDENRYLVRQGLELLNERKRVGLAALGRVANLQDREIDATAISYRLAPRLNAPGRISNSRPALELLCASDPVEADRLAQVLENENIRRREMTEFVNRSVTKKLEALDDPGALGAIVLADSEWDEGILGIAASRIVETYGRPAILISCAGDLAKGSGRSVPGIHLKEQLDLCEDVLLRYGGHAQAVGVTIEPSLVETFIEKISRQLAVAAGTLPGKQVLSIDAEIKLGDCSTELLDFLALCQPFGSGNPEPVFSLSRLSVTKATQVGNGDHLKIQFRDDENLDGDAIFFNSGSIGPKDITGKPVDIAFSLKRGYYLNRYYPELRVIDIRTHRD